MDGMHGAGSINVKPDLVSDQADDQKVYASKINYLPGNPDSFFDRSNNGKSIYRYRVAELPPKKGVFEGEKALGSNEFEKSVDDLAALMAEPLSSDCLAFFRGEHELYNWLVSTLYNLEKLNGSQVEANKIKSAERANFLDQKLGKTGFDWRCFPLAFNYDSAAKTRALSALKNDDFEKNIQKKVGFLPTWMEKEYKGHTLGRAYHIYWELRQTAAKTFKKSPYTQEDFIHQYPNLAKMLSDFANESRFDEYGFTQQEVAAFGSWLDNSDNCANGAVSNKGCWSWQNLKPSKVDELPFNKKKADFYTTIPWKDLPSPSEKVRGRGRKRKTLEPLGDVEVKQPKLEDVIQRAADFDMDDMTEKWSNGLLHTAYIPGLECYTQPRLDISDLKIDPKTGIHKMPSPAIEDSGEREPSVKEERFLISEQQLTDIKVDIAGLELVVTEEGDNCYELNTALLVDVILAALNRQQGMFATIESLELMDALEYLNEYHMAQEAGKVGEFASEALESQQQRFNRTEIDHRSETVRKIWSLSQSVLKKSANTDDVSAEVQGKIKLLLDFQAQYLPVAEKLLDLLNLIKSRIGTLEENNSTKLQFLEEMEALTEISALQMAIKYYLASLVPGADMEDWQRLSHIIKQPFQALQGKIELKIRSRVSIPIDMYQVLDLGGVESISGEVDVSVDRFRTFALDALERAEKEYRLKTGIWDLDRARVEFECFGKTIRLLKDVEDKEGGGRAYREYYALLSSLQENIQIVSTGLQQANHDQAFKALKDTIRLCRQKFDFAKDA